MANATYYLLWASANSFQIGALGKIRHHGTAEVANQSQGMTGISPGFNLGYGYGTGFTAKGRLRRGFRIRLRRRFSYEACLPSPRSSRRTQRWEGSRPRDPWFPKPRAFRNQGRKYTVGFENAFAARGDPTSPPLRELYLLQIGLCRTGSAPSLSGVARPHMLPRMRGRETTYAAP